MLVLAWQFGFGESRFMSCRTPSRTTDMTVEPSLRCASSMLVVTTPMNSESITNEQMITNDTKKREAVNVTKKKRGT